MSYVEKHLDFFFFFFKFFKHEIHIYYVFFSVWPQNDFLSIGLIRSNNNDNEYCFKKNNDNEYNFVLLRASHGA